jgi:hypothetical protein
MKTIDLNVHKGWWEYPTSLALAFRQTRVEYSDHSSQTFTTSPPKTSGAID